jgi:hypothetical protein
MKNNSLAMIATIAAVGALASLTGYIDPAICGRPQENSWMSCEVVANQTLTAFWACFAVAAASLTGYLLQLRKANRALRGKR